MEVFKVTATLAFAYYAMSQSLQLMSKALANPNSVDSINEKRNLAKRLRRPEVETMSFDNYELRIMDSVVGVDELDVTFDDIGGLEQELEDVHDNVVLPLRLWRANQLEEIRAKANGTTANQQLCPLPTGIMLFGQPGTGKSLIGKAIAVECKATFINIKASSILDKFVGESDKLASALFRLGRKLGPSIIFIDEIETLLRKRDSDSGSTNGVVQTLQGVFLSEWDGLVVDRDDRGKDKEGKSASAQPPVVILGATNRPADIDPAFLRRMPVRIQTRMPDAAARAEILSALLKKETHIGSDVDLVSIAQAAEDFSGSDLRELVRVAVLQREKSRLQSLKSSMGDDASLLSAAANGIPAVTQAHFLFALNKQLAARQKTDAFNEELFSESDKRAMRLMRAFANNSSSPNAQSGGLDDVHIEADGDGEDGEGDFHEIARA